MLWWIACSTAKLDVGASTEDGYADTGLGVPEAGEMDDSEAPSMHWWQLIADLRVGDSELSVEGSRLEVWVYDEQNLLQCIQPYVIVESVLTESRFDEALVWWRLNIKPFENHESGDTAEGALGICADNLSMVPGSLQLGIGDLHVEALAAWEFIEWDDLEPVPLEQSQTLKSSYISLDSGQNVWVYGVAQSTLEESQAFSQDEWLMSDQIWSMRPCFYFPFQ